MQDTMAEIICVTKKDRSGLTSIENCLDATIQGLKNYIKKSKEKANNSSH